MQTLRLLRQTIIASCATCSLAVAAETKPLRLLTSTPVIADLVQEATCLGAKDGVVSLVPLDTDPHSFVLTPKARLLLESQTHLIVVGSNYETWFNRLTPPKKTHVLILSKELKLTSDPHFWQSPTLTLAAAESIVAFISSTTTIDRKKTNACLERYRETVSGVTKELHKQVADVPEVARSIATNHDALENFGKEFNIRIESLLGFSSEDRPSPASLRSLTESLKSGKVRAAFIETSSSPREMEAVARSSGVTLGGKLIVDTLTDGPPAATIVEMWRYNLQTIVKALKQKNETAKDAK